jgi:hypothetical protein
MAMSLKTSIFATTALVLCVSTSVARTETMPADANAEFMSWYGGPPAVGAKHPIAAGNDSAVLYDQSASSGFSKYGISSFGVSGSAACSGCSQTMAADDFIIPGTGNYNISAVYTPGEILSGTEPTNILVTFYDVLKYSGKTRKTTIVPKTSCDTNSFSDRSGHGDFMVDVTSCNLGKFRAGHDYSVSVQPWFWSNGSWAWQTNHKQIKRQAFFVHVGGNGTCNEYFRPVKICFSGKGYGPDLAFAIYGMKL